MNFRTIKTLAVTSAVALALFAGTTDANAQATATMATTFSTGAALTAANVSDFDFGTYVINVGGTDTFTIPIPAVVAGTVGAVVCGGVVDASSVCSELTAPSSSGVVSVTSPVALDVQISGSVSTDFIDGALTIPAASLTYLDTAANTGTIPAAFAPTEVVTVATANVAENIGIGATLEIGGPTGGVSPAASTTFNDAVITVNFQF